MSKARLTGAILLTVLMLVSMLPVFMAGVSEAATSVTLQVYPNKVVQGQDVLFTVIQTGGTWTAGSQIAVKVKNTNTWGTGSGYMWYTLPAGAETIPQGRILYIPASTALTDLLGSTNLATGTAYVILGENGGEGGAFSAEFTVESGTPPFLAVNGVTNPPSALVTVTYTSYTATAPEPQFQITGTGNSLFSSGGRLNVYPGQTVTVSYYVPGNTVTFYLDYYGSPIVLATASGGTGTVQFTMPDTVQGLHAIVAVSDTGYSAFQWIWVDPIITPSTFSIAGTIGETVTFQGRGFPAGATVTALTYNVYQGNTLAETETAITVSSGTADASGRITFSATLDANIVNTGLITVDVQVDNGVDPLTGLGTEFFYPDEKGPAVAPDTDTIPNVMAVSNPNLYGDEALAIVGAAPGPVNVNVGDYISLAVVNFPANTRVDFYIGPKLAGSVVTDSRGAATTTILVPVLPGYDHTGAQINYELRAIAVDPATGATLVAKSPTPGGATGYTIHIGAVITHSVSPAGFGSTANYYKSGYHTVTVRITGLSPYALVTIQEQIEYFNTPNPSTGLPTTMTVNILQWPYNYFYNPQIIVGAGVSGTSFIADVNGVLEVQYTVAYDDVLAWNMRYPFTGGDVVVQASAQTQNTPPVTITLTGTLPSYKEIGPITVDPASYSVPHPRIPGYTTPDTAGSYSVFTPGDIIQATFSGLIPGEYYVLLVDNNPVQMYDTADVAIAWFMATADNVAGDGIPETATIRFQVPDALSWTGFKPVAVKPLNPALDIQAVDEIILSDGIKYGAYKDVAVNPTSIQILPSGTVQVTVIGYNFDNGETLEAGIAGITTTPLPTGTATQRGAVAVTITVNMPVQAGDYVAFIRRTSTGDTFRTVIHFTGWAGAAQSIIGTVYKAVGETVTITATGLEPNKVYAVKWAENYGDNGKYITNTGIPGLGTPLTWISDATGTLTATFTVPFSVINEDYYAYIVDPVTGDPVLDPVQVIIQTPKDDTTPAAWIVDIPTATGSLTAPFAAIPTDSLTIRIQNAINFITDNTGTVAPFADPFNPTLFPNLATAADQLAFFVAHTVATATLTYESGEKDTVLASLYTDGVDLYVSFTMPNVNLTAMDIVGITLNFEGAALYNDTAVKAIKYDTWRGSLDIGGAYYLPQGGALLTSVLDQLVNLVTTVNGTLTQVSVKIDDLSAIITSVNDNVVAMNTTLGMVYADLQDVKQLLGDVNASVVMYGEEILVALNSSSGQVLASLDAIAQLINDSTLTIRGDLAVINTTLGQISIDVTNLALLLQGLGDTLVAKIDQNLNLTEIAVMQGEQIIMTLEGLNVTLQQLQPLVTDLQDGVATLQTLVGTLQTSINDLAQGQVEIKNLIQNSAGDIIAVVDTGVTTLNATLNAAVEMLQEGIATAQDNVLAQLASVNATLAAAVSDVKAAVDNGFQTLGAAVDQAKTELADQIGAVQADVTTVKADVADVKTTLADVSTQLTNVNNRLNDVATKDDVSGAKDELAGKIDQLAQTVQDQTSQAASKAQTWGMINLVVGIVILALAGYLLVQVRQQAS